MGRLLLKFMVGGLAGLFIWMIFEPSAPNPGTEAWQHWEVYFTLVLSGAIGLSVGGLDGFTQGGKIHFLRGVVLGLIFGMIGGSLGYKIGGTIVEATFGSGVFMHGNVATATMARIMALTPLGACLGAAIGASSLTARRTVQGLVGGAIGGAVGGAIFDTVGTLFGSFALAAK